MHALAAAMTGVPLAPHVCAPCSTAWSCHLPAGGGLDGRAGMGRRPDAGLCRAADRLADAGLAQLGGKHLYRHRADPYRQLGHRRCREHAARRGGRRVAGLARCVSDMPYCGT